MGIPLHVESTQMQEHVYMLLHLRFKLSVLCRQLEAYGDAVCVVFCPEGL